MIHTEPQLPPLNACPKMYRTMEVDPSGRPQLGRNLKNALGIRIPPHAHPDIIPDHLGNVSPAPQGGMLQGMSVSRSLRELPSFLIPRRLRATLGIAKASGQNTAAVWSMGSGPYVDSPMQSLLQLRIVHASAHGLVEPSAVTPLALYEQAIEGTRDHWQIDEA
jgi:hypothetical protein